MRDLGATAWIPDHCVFAFAFQNSLLEKQTGALKLVASLYRNVVCETVLAAGVLLIVGLLGVIPPPMH
jgi:hypothetical protein